MKKELYIWDMNNTQTHNTMLPSIYARVANKPTNLSNVELYSFYRNNAKECHEAVTFYGFTQNATLEQRYNLAMLYRLDKELNEARHNYLAGVRRPNL
jgi:hypothetical protein